MNAILLTVTPHLLDDVLRNNMYIVKHINITFIRLLYLIYYLIFTYVIARENYSMAVSQRGFPQKNCNYFLT